ncbi:OsmC family protein [Aliiruegeria lutimaris]|uniref:OsmC-like protein n=1 Tax=Aliiruegeria lutimaris TaxID=571298 RepID=A0A1G9NFN0_9RHOB|nr:OsmC family protein [Aliiruegeria lutimaris]SDL85131.1 OsmC-like protein [Aliiruegeria lutimaris]
MTYLQTPPVTETARDRVIREAQSAVVERIRADPAKARSTLRTTGHVGEGLACEVVQGPFSATLDLGKGMGGDAAGPSPGFFARAAIAGCVGIAVKMLAAREGVRFNCVDIAVETDFDDAALFGIGGGNAAPVRTRVSIDIDTDAQGDIVESIVDRALAMDPWFLALGNAQDVSATVSVAR